eukprot:2053099-Alexandrium_andersonii.AAC.1
MPLLTWFGATLRAPLVHHGDHGQRMVKTCSGHDCSLIGARTGHAQGMVGALPQGRKRPWSEARWGGSMY